MNEDTKKRYGIIWKVKDNSLHRYPRQNYDVEWISKNDIRILLSKVDNNTDMNLLEYFNKVCSNEEYYNFHHNSNIEIGMWVRHNLKNNENDN